MRINVVKEDCVSMQDIVCGGPQSKNAYFLEKKSAAGNTKIMLMLTFSSLWSLESSQIHGSVSEV